MRPLPPKALPIKQKKRNNQNARPLLEATEGEEKLALNKGRFFVRIKDICRIILKMK